MKTLPTAGQRGSGHNLDDFGKDKPIEAEAYCESKRMREDGEPGQSAHKKANLSQNAGDGGPGETLFSVLSIENPASNASNERIRQQKAAGGTQQLRQASESRGIKYWHPHEAFPKIKNERGEGATWAESKPYEQNAEILQR